MKNLVPLREEKFDKATTANQAVFYINARLQPNSRLYQFAPLTQLNQLEEARYHIEIPSISGKIIIAQVKTSEAHLKCYEVSFSYSSETKQEVVKAIRKIITEELVPLQKRVPSGTLDELLVA